MNDKQALQLHADVLQARMDSLAELAVRLTEEKLLILELQTKINQQYEQLALERDAIEKQLSEHLSDELM